MDEVKSEKTTLTVELLKELMLLIDSKEITVIDITPQKIGKVEGRLLAYIG